MKIRLAFALPLSLIIAIPAFAMNKDLTDTDIAFNAAVDTRGFQDGFISVRKAIANGQELIRKNQDQQINEYFQDDSPEFLAALQNMPLAETNPMEQTPPPHNVQNQQDARLYDQLVLARSMFTRTLENAPKTPTKKHINAIQGVVDAIQTSLRPYVDFESPPRTNRVKNNIRPGTDPSKMFNVGAKQIRNIARKLDLPNEHLDVLDTATGRLYDVYTQVPHDQALRTASGTLHQFFQPMNNNNNNNNQAITNDRNDQSVRTIQSNSSNSTEDNNSAKRQRRD